MLLGKLAVLAICNKKKKIQRRTIEGKVMQMQAWRVIRCQWGVRGSKNVMDRVNRYVGQDSNTQSRTKIISVRIRNQKTAREK